jgi:predicted nucleic acid-binding protein
MIVVDTNIIAYMTFATEHSTTVSSLHEKNSVWEAPLLWKSEFLNILSLYYRKRLIDYQESLDALGFAERLIGPREHKVDAQAVIECLINSTCSSYDCEFVALAENLGTKLITYDKKIIKDFPAVALEPEAYLAQFK